MTRNPKTTAEPKSKKPSRKDQLIGMFMRPDGATIDEVVAEMGLQPHSARAVLSVEQRKRGLTLRKEARDTGPPSLNFVVSSNPRAVDCTNRRPSLVLG